MAAESDSGHFRIAFLGYHESYGGELTRAAPEPDSRPSAWDTASDEEMRAYFQADISWINLGDGDAPHTAALSAKITGDVRGLRGLAGGKEGASSAPARSLPLSLGTYALAAGRNAVAIANPEVQSAIPSRTFAYPAQEQASGRIGPAHSLDLPISHPVRGRVLFLDYQTAQRLARTDLGNGRGVFPMRYRDPDDPDRDITLFFAIERLA